MYQSNPKHLALKTQGYSRITAFSMERVDDPPPQKLCTKCLFFTTFRFGTCHCLTMFNTDIPCMVGSPLEMCWTCRGHDFMRWRTTLPVGIHMNPTIRSFPCQHVLSIAAIWRICWSHTSDILPLVGPREIDAKKQLLHCPLPPLPFDFGFATASWLRKSWQYSTVLNDPACQVIVSSFQQHHWVVSTVCHETQLYYI